MTYPVAIPFGVRTCNTADRAMARTGDADGNAGAEAIDAALEMVALRQALASAPRRARSRANASSRSTR
jgi:6,7-dimethyl-8-ribityllumazine synthase